MFENSNACCLSAKQHLVLQKNALSIQRLLAEELVILSGEAGFGSLCEDWKVRTTSLQFKKGCSGIYVEPFVVVHDSVVSHLALVSHVVHQNCLYSEGGGLSFVKGILSVSAKFLLNFLPLHFSSCK